MRVPSRRRPTRRFAGVLVLALLLAQWLALVHGVLHAPRASASTIVVADSADGFVHDIGTPDCRLFDQLLSGQAPAPQAACAAPAPEAHTPTFTPSSAPTPAPARRYRAREPPLTA